MDFLSQRGTGLFLGTAAPELFGKTSAQHRPRVGQGDHGEQGTRLAAAGQDALAAHRPGFHLANQPQPHDDLIGGQRRSCHKGNAWQMIFHSLAVYSYVFSNPAGQFAPDPNQTRQLPYLLSPPGLDSNSSTTYN